ncbi:hypothetical protein P170DRAFT_436145 [Aspergillus steynii IBT 23096]|uniref:Uncharacterized protein n=1 Tax=Aspergillus steynii IBT 23096 TaxID=1392250 RepID=A0A2I2GDX9_9EURO|nr:uncharacterized protein P170DRAFT_436145 [Aspergillus steynii IBT 23096]PLB51070.1 hypothetical protein P170DRAFT_436145 [Aspergillus steynii IBT 23096]
MFISTLYSDILLLSILFLWKFGPHLGLFLKNLSPFPQSPLLKKNSSSGPFPKHLLILKAGLLLLFPITKYYPRLLIKHKPKVI